MTKTFQPMPWYSVHHWCPSDYSLDSDRSPRKNVQYQYDSINDTYYSLPYLEDMYLLQYETKVDDSDNIYKLCHFTDSDTLEVKQFLALFIRPAQCFSNEFDDLAYVAFTQRYGFENRKVGDLIFLHLLKQGHCVEDIVESLINGAFPEIEEGYYPQLRRSLTALRNKLPKPVN